VSVKALKHASPLSPSGIPSGPSRTSGERQRAAHSTKDGGPGRHSCLPHRQERTDLGTPSQPQHSTEHTPRPEPESLSTRAQGQVLLVLVPLFALPRLVSSVHTGGRRLLASCRHAVRLRALRRRDETRTKQRRGEDCARRRQRSTTHQRRQEDPRDRNRGGQGHTAMRAVELAFRVGGCVVSVCLLAPKTGKSKARAHRGGSQQPPTTTESAQRSASAGQKDCGKGGMA
jgi:hypothetical protein